MCNSLPNQYLIQTPDCHLFTKTVGCISGCVSGIAPVLKLGPCVLVDRTIIGRLRTQNRQTLSSNSPRTKNIERKIIDVFNRSRFMVALPLEAE